METDSAFDIGQKIKIEAGSTRAETDILGYRPGAYIVLNNYNGQTMPSPGSETIARVATESGYFGFSTQMLGQLYEIKSAVLKYPEETIATSFRKCERYNIFIPVNVNVELESGEKLEPSVGAVRDLSESGCLLSVDMMIRKGAQVSMSGVFFGQKASKTITGDVRRAERIEGSFRYGIEFSSFVDTQKEAVTTLIESLRNFDDCHDTSLVFGGSKEITSGVQCKMLINRVMYTSIIRGMLKGKYILTDVPTVKGQPPILSKGAEVQAEIRYIQGAAAFGFTTNLLTHYNSPIRMWAWQYPDDIEQLSIRKSERITTVIPTLFGKTERLVGAILDLSDGGAMIVFYGDQKFKKDAEAEMSVLFPTGHTIKDLPCVVKDIKSIGGKTVISVAFLPPGTPQHEKMKDYYKDYISKFL